MRHFDYKHDTVWSFAAHHTSSSVNVWRNAAEDNFQPKQMIVAVTIEWEVSTVHLLLHIYTMEGFLRTVCPSQEVTKLLA